MSIWAFAADFFGGAAGAASVLLLAFLSPYVREKVKNVATKQDIEEITRKVETVKAEIQSDLQLRFLAAEKRLEAHQEAYTLAIELLSSNRSDRDAMDPMYERLASFYRTKSLYLDRKIRPAFTRAMGAAKALPPYKGQGQNFAPLVREMNQAIIDLPGIIEAATPLPSMEPADATAPETRPRETAPAAE